MKYLPIFIGILLLFGVVSADPPIMSFTSNVTMGYQPLSVQFNDTSETNITGWVWDFSDGNTSTDQNPVHTFWNGDYQIFLNVTNASGYDDSDPKFTISVSDSGGLSGWNRQDIMMDQIYTVIMNIKDSSTLMGIPSATIMTSNGDNLTTSVLGVASLSTNYTALVVNVGATGYYSRSLSYVVDRDRTETIYLTADTSTSPGTPTNLNLLYPHEVRIITVDNNGNRLPGVATSVVMLNTTTYGTNWWSYLYGISASATPMNSTILTGLTDGYGSIVFPMISSSLYRFTFSQPSTGISKTLDLYPDQAAYTFILATTATAPILNSGDYITQNLTVVEAAPLLYLNMSYNDSYHTTSDTTFYVKWANLTPVYSKVFPSILGSNQSVTTGYGLTNIKGNAYIWGFYANNTQFGWINNSMGVTMKGPDGILYNPFVYKGTW
jgi:PKD repeat protein